MADYTKVTNWTLKDSLNSTILGSDFETELGAVQTMSTTKVNKVGSPTANNLMSMNGTGDAADSGLTITDTPQTDEVIVAEKSICFDAVVDMGTGGWETFTWNNGNKQKYSINASATFAFVAPSGPCNMVLKITNVTSARTITWPAAVKWAGGVVPTPSAGVDVYTFFYDGTNYYGGAVLDMS